MSMTLKNGYSICISWRVNTMAMFMLFSRDDAWGASWILVSFGAANGFKTDHFTSIFNPQLIFQLILAV